MRLPFSQKLKAKKMPQPGDKRVENKRARKETKIEPIRKWKMPKEAVPVNAMGFHLELNKKEGRETLSKRGRDSLARKRKKKLRIPMERNTKT